MESISKRTGKKFTGRFASTALRIGLATPSGEPREVKPKVVKTPPQQIVPKRKAKRKAKK